MTRFLLVTNIFPPQIGGPATFIERVAHSISDIGGNRVTVVCSSEQREVESDRHRNYSVRRIYGINPLHYHITVRRVLFKEFMVHRNILVNGLETFVFPIAKVLRRRYVLKVVGDSVWEFARNTGRTCLDIDQFQLDGGAQRAFASLVARRNSYAHQARMVITPSEYLRRMVIGWGVPEDRVITVLNGVDGEADSLPLTRSSGPLRVVFVGRLTNWKGVETLLLAVSELDHVEAIIVGDGPELPLLQAMSSQLGLENRVQFLGRLDKDQVREQMKRAHVLVLTSLYEGLSHTLLEAMALGLPCVAADRGGNAEVIDTGKDGVLVPAQNPKALRAALEMLQSDEATRNRLACAALEKSRDFAMARTVCEVVPLLLENAI